MYGAMQGGFMAGMHNAKAGCLYAPNSMSMGGPDYGIPYNQLGVGGMVQAGGTSGGYPPQMGGGAGARAESQYYPQAQYYPQYSQQPQYGQQPQYSQQPQYAPQPQYG